MQSLYHPYRYLDQDIWGRKYTRKIAWSIIFIINVNAAEVVIDLYQR